MNLFAETLQHVSAAAPPPSPHRDHPDSSKARGDHHGEVLLIATFLTLVALLVVLCTAKQLVPVTQAQAATVNAAPIATPAPAQASESGIIYVANHGAWG